MQKKKSRPNRKTRRLQRRNTRLMTRNAPNPRLSDFTDIRSFRGENLVNLRLRTDPYIIQIANGASTFTSLGGTSGLLSIDISNLSTDSGTLVSQFMQYRIVAIQAQIYPLVDQGGTSAFSFIYYGTDTAQEYARESEVAIFKNSINALNKREIWWKVTDYINAEWVNQGTSPQVAYPNFLYYTDNSEWGTPTNSSGAAKSVYRINMWFYVELRGLK